MTRFFVLDYHPINTKVTTDLSDNTVIVNTTFNINCSAQANPAAKYRFYAGMKSFENDTTGSDVAVITTSVSERLKQVNYSCTPFNYYGDGPTEVIAVKVQCKYVVHMMYIPLGDCLLLLFH